jgi:hypothetical protein
MKPGRRNAMDRSSRGRRSGDGSSLTVRSALVEDVAQMARGHVRCWQETYRGLMPDAVLDDPGFLAARERFWTAAQTDERYRRNRTAVAEREGGLIGIAMSGPPLDAGAAWVRQLSPSNGPDRRSGRRRKVDRDPGRCRSLDGWRGGASRSPYAPLHDARVLLRRRLRRGAARAGDAHHRPVHPRRINVDAVL